MTEKSPLCYCTGSHMTEKSPLCYCTGSHMTEKSLLLLYRACTGVGSQMTEKYFFDCLSDMYYGEDLSDALTSTLAYADYCEVTLGLSSWPARTLCNYFPISKL